MFGFWPIPENMVKLGYYIELFNSIFGKKNIILWIRCTIVIDTYMEDKISSEIKTLYIRVWDGSEYPGILGYPDPDPLNLW